MSFFEALVEGTANAAANSLGNYQKRQQMLDDEERTNANALEKYKQQIQIQQDMAEQARQAKQERLQTQIAQADEEGGKLTRAQALAALNKDYGSNLTEADVTQEELDAYGPNELGKIDNKLKAARSAGLYDAADSLSAERKATVEAMREAFKEQIALRRAATDEQRANAADDRNAAMWAKAMSGGAGGAGGVKLRSTFTDGNGKRVGVMSDGSTIELGTGTSFDYNKAVAGVVTNMTKNVTGFSKLPAAEQRKRAEELLKGVVPEAEPSTGTPAKSGSAPDKRKPLSAFNK